MAKTAQRQDRNICTCNDLSVEKSEQGIRSAREKCVRKISARDQVCEGEMCKTALLVACKLQQQEDCKTASHCKLQQQQRVGVSAWHDSPWESQNCAETVDRAQPKWRKSRTGRKLQWPICRKIRVGDK